MKEPIPRWMERLLLPISLACFAMMFWHLWFDRTASAGTAAAIGFGFILFRILPELESIQVLGMSAKLKRQLAEADEQTERLKALTETNARHAMLSLAYSNRWGGMPRKEQQRAYDDLVQQLNAQDVDKNTIEGIVDPYLSMQSRDLFSIFTNVLSEVLVVYRNKYDEAIQQAQSEGDAGKASALMAAKEAYNESIALNAFNPRNDSKNFRGAAEKLLDSIKLSTRDRARLDQLVGDLSKQSEAIWKDLRVDTSTIEFIEDNEKNRKPIVSEYFPDGADGPDWPLN